MTALINRLPKTTGAITPMAPMARHTWFGVGGMAEVMFTPENRDDLAAFLKNLPGDIPVFALGAGSNLLVRDGGIPGVVVNTSALNHAEYDADADTMEVGAGLHDAETARIAARNGASGLEFLIGIPGTIGGGLRMNAGSYGTEFKDIVIEAEAVDRKGRVYTATPIDMGMGYRNSNAPADWIFTAARLTTGKDNPEAIRARMKDITRSRGTSQPTGARTGGSTFANPDGHKAWELIDAAGCRGMVSGSAAVSDKHCNFLINTGGATAHDIETLGETVRQRVAEQCGVELRWEIRRVGAQPESKEAVA